MLQLPCSLVLVSCRTEVWSEMTATSAPGTAAPCASITRPLNVARVSCAKRDAARHTNRVRTARIKRFTMTPVPKRLLKPDSNTGHKNAQQYKALKKFFFFLWVGVWCGYI